MGWTWSFDRQIIQTFLFQIDRNRNRRFISFKLFLYFIFFFFFITVLIILCRIDCILQIIYVDCRFRGFPFTLQFFSSPQRPQHPQQQSHHRHAQQDAPKQRRQQQAASPSVNSSAAFWSRKINIYVLIILLGDCYRAQAFWIEKLII